MDTQETLLADLDHEMAVTRRLIERIPPDALSWRPHDKSFTFGELATHLSRLPRWGGQILAQPSHDLLSGKNDIPSLPTLDEVLGAFDRQVAEVRRALAERTTAQLGEVWTLTRGRETVLSLPKAAAFRRYLLSHVIHHRGQLTVYLRLNGVALPPIYGPTADGPL